MRVLAGSDSSLAYYLLPQMRGNHQVTAFDGAMGDIRDTGFLATLLDEARPDVFINCFEKRGAAACEYGREEAYSINAFAAGELGRICRERDILLVQMSSSLVFDGAGSEPPGEGSATSPLQAYGDSKALGEKLIIESGCRHIIARFPDLFGASASFLQDILEGIKQSGAVHNLKERRISPTYALDAAGALDALISKGAGGIFHIANSGDTCVGEFMAVLNELLIKKGDEPFHYDYIEYGYDDFPYPADLPLHDVLDCSRVNELLGQHLRSWREALAVFLDEPRPVCKES